MEAGIKTGEINQSGNISAVALLLGWVVTTIFLWGFAFFHLPGATPEWLLRAQSACFGRTETGLPDVNGWILLIFAPLSLLLAMVVALQEEMLVGVIRLISSRFGQLVVLTLAFSVVAEGLWIWTRIAQGFAVAASSQPIESSTAAFPESYPQTDEIATNFTLVGQKGEKVSLSDFLGRPVILTFAFAHCRTVCPLLIKNAQKARSLAPELNSVLLVVTLDPWRDTPSSLPTLATTWNFKDGEYILSGAVEEVQKVLSEFQMQNAPDQKTGDIVHPALTFIIGGDGRINYTLNGASAEWIVSALKRSDSIKRSA